MSRVSDLVEQLREFRDAFGDLDVVLIQPDSFGQRYQFTDPIIELTATDRTPSGEPKADYAAAIIRGRESAPLAPVFGPSAIRIRSCEDHAEHLPHRFQAVFQCLGIPPRAECGSVAAHAPHTTDPRSPRGRIHCNGLGG